MLSLFIFLCLLCNTPVRCNTNTIGRLFDFHLFIISKQLTYQTVDLSEIVFAASAMQYEDQIYI